MPPGKLEGRSLKDFLAGLIVWVGVVAVELVGWEVVVEVDDVGDVVVGEVVDVVLEGDFDVLAFTEGGLSSLRVTTSMMLSSPS